MSQPFWEAPIPQDLEKAELKPVSIPEPQKKITSDYDVDVEATALMRIGGTLFIGLFFLAFGAASLFMIILGANSILTEGSESEVFFIGIFFSIVPIGCLWFFLNLYSRHSFYVDVNSDIVAYESLLRGLNYKWRKSRKPLSEVNSMTTSHATSSSEERTNTIHFYKVHGQNQVGEEWKIDISHIIRGQNMIAPTEPAFVASEIATAMGVSLIDNGHR
tara:strand:+ start:98 stop:751 length:654 start_codon:yes stop_codon:yes gene_type:complete